MPSLNLYNNPLTKGNFLKFIHIDHIFKYIDFLCVCRIVNTWNNLPNSVILALYEIIFKNKADQFGNW